jgi:hypothetical protein
MKLWSRIPGVVLFAFVALLLTSCMAGVGAGPWGVPFDAPQKCSEYCTKMGMGLGAVVVMANQVGCVCTPSGRASSAELTGGATAGGMTAILIQQQQQAQAAAQQQHH